ncbi:MAG: aromatic ring-hydroxylating dioxygenase subunit alpha [Parvularculaceae bacterium]
MSVRLGVNIRNEDKMLRDYWYIACAGSQLGKEPKAVRVLDKDIVVFRDAEGVAHALLDRCCHRGVKLSRGKVQENGKIACGYHGWQYDGATGRCIHVPSMHPDANVPENFVVPSFPVAEQDSYVWVWMGEGAPEPARPPVIDGFNDHGWMQGVTEFNCNHVMVIENQFDSCHPAYTHVGTHPAYLFLKARGARESTIELRLTESGFMSFMPPAKTDDERVPEKTVMFATFDLPGRVFLRQRAAMIDFQIFLHVVPTGPSSCRMEWLQRTKSAGHSIQYVEEDPVINVEDRIVLESSQPWYDQCGNEFERHVEADQSTMMVRKVIASAETGKWNEARANMKQRRLITFRS